MTLVLGEEITTGEFTIFHDDDTNRQDVTLSIDVDFELGTLFHLQIQAQAFHVSIGPFSKEDLTKMVKILETARQEIDYLTDVTNTPPNQPLEQCGCVQELRDQTGVGCSCTDCYDSTGNDDVPCCQCHDLKVI